MVINQCILPQRKGFFKELTLNTLYHALRSNKLTAIELVDNAIYEMKTLNPVLNAFSFIAEEKAIIEALQADKELRAGHDRGILHGIPLGIKDNILTKDMPTTMGSVHYQNYYPENDADCVKRLKEAGAIIVGKTTTHEFAYGPTGDCSLQGATYNPWDISRIPGGSSCGSAVAVAVGAIPVALGTDTGGSIRIPAAINGIVGFKPSFETISTKGVFPLSSTLDHVGILANNAIDISVLLSILSDKYNDAIKGTDIIKGGWVNPYCFGQCNPAIVSQIRNKLNNNENLTLRNTNEVNEVAELMRLSFSDIQRSEAYEIHEGKIENHPERYQKETLTRLLRSQNVKGWEYVRAMKNRDKLRYIFNDIFKEYDVLMMPTLPIYAPKLYERELNIDGKKINIRDSLLSLTSPWNLLGLPAISIPYGVVNNMPVGLQIIAKEGEDYNLLKIANMYLLDN